MDYQIYLEMVNNLETIKEHKLQDSHLARELAKTLYEDKVTNLEKVNCVAGFFIRYRPPSDDSDSLRTITLTAGDWLSSEFLADKLRPWVLHIRRTLFNSETAPFNNWEEAWLWCKDELQKALREGKRLPAEMEGPVGPFGEYLRQRQEYTPATAFMEEVDHISKATGFYSTSVLSFVLTDSKPVLSKTALDSKEGIYRLPGGEDLKYRFLTLTVKDDISFEDLRSLYQQIRQKLHLTKKKRLKDKHLQLYRLVQARGNGPLKGRGSVAFWRSVMDDCNKSYPQIRYGGYKSVKRAYELTIRKLRANHFQT